jgi:hypothetical protein
MVSSSLPKVVNGTGGSNHTSQIHPGGSHPRSMSSSSKKLLAPVTSTNSSTSWNSVSYYEALNVLSEETMSQACALALQETDASVGVRNKQPSLSSSRSDKNDTSAVSTNASTENDQQEEQGTNSAPQNPNADDTALISTVDARQKELEKLQQLFSRCCQAVSIFERESTLLQQQQKFFPSQSGMSSAIPGGGGMARTKASSGVILNASAGHRTSLIRNGSGRVPPGGGASTLPIVATSTKGSMGAALSTITGIGGIHRRRPLEREKSDSSSTTTASSSKAGVVSSSSYLKTTMRNTADETGNHPKKIGKNGSDVVPPPPPSAMQFLAMLNNDTSNSTPAKKAESATDVIEPKRSGDTKPLGSISPPSAKRVKVSPPKIAPSNVPSETSPVRIQPPRASRK